jgi:hypothetical protein
LKVEAQQLLGARDQLLADVEPAGSDQRSMTWASMMQSSV